jgi:hypothetical protein
VTKLLCVEWAHPLARYASPTDHVHNFGSTLNVLPVRCAWYLVVVGVRRKGYHMMWGWLAELFARTSATKARMQGMIVSDTRNMNIHGIVSTNS